MKFFSKEINREVPITDVMKKYGLDTQGNGHGKIPCPSVYHRDKNPSAKIYENSNICKCFSCTDGNGVFKPITIVMQQENVDFYRACEMLVEEYHLSDDCYEMTDAEKRELGLIQKEEFPLTHQEIELLDLSSDRGRIPISYEQVEDGYYDKNGKYRHYRYEELNNPSPFPSNNVITKDVMYMNLRALWENDKTAFHDLVTGKIVEKDGYLDERIADMKEFILEVNDIMTGVAVKSELSLSEMVKMHKENPQVFKENSTEFHTLELYFLSCSLEERVEKMEEDKKRLEKIAGKINVPLQREERFTEETRAKEDIFEEYEEEEEDRAI